MLEEKAGSNAKNTEHFRGTYDSMYPIFLKYKVKCRAPLIKVFASYA